LFYVLFIFGYLSVVSDLFQMQAQSYEFFFIPATKQYLFFI